jgi:outer membrane protein assembly factor BamB
MARPDDNFDTRGLGRQRILRASALGLTIVTVCFSAVIADRLLQAHLAGPAIPYTDNPELVTLQARLVEVPDDPETIRLIRRQDVQLRTSFFDRRAVTDSGRWLLAAGLVATVLASQWFVSIGRKMDLPPLDAGSEEPDWPVEARRNASAVAVGAAIVCLALLTAALAGHSALPGKRAITLTGRWPAFRGPKMTGVVPEGRWPETWNAETGENILWVCPIPGRGNSSPVVWGRRVFVTTATHRQNWVHCVDAAEGRVAWSRRVVSPADAPAMAPDDVMDMTGFAAPTPVTDGEHLWATFANADVVCFDVDGTQTWVRNLGKPKINYGRATSLVLHRGLVILQNDQGDTPEDGLSSIIAFDKVTGKTVWETDRDMAGTWTTPIIIGPDEGLDRYELITCGDPYVIAYNPADGKELWRADGLGGEVAPMPTFAGGRVFAVNTGSLVMAIRPGGSGDVTESHVAWVAEDGLPSMVSPVASATHYLQVDSDMSLVTCYRANDGRMLWEQRLEAETFKASPSLVGDRVFLTDGEGTTWVFRLADEFKLIRTCMLGEPVSASSAYADGRIYIRTESNLYCIAPNEDDEE